MMLVQLSECTVVLIDTVTVNGSPGFARGPGEARQAQEQQIMTGEIMAKISLRLSSSRHHLICSVLCARLRGRALSSQTHADRQMSAAATADTTGPCCRVTQDQILNDLHRSVPNAPHERGDPCPYCNHKIAFHDNPPPAPAGQQQRSHTLAVLLLERPHHTQPPPPSLLLRPCLALQPGPTLWSRSRSRWASLSRHGRAVRSPSTAAAVAAS